MSYQITAKIICDGCGLFIEGKPEHRATWAKRPLWNAQTQAEKQGWVTLDRGRYHTQKHYCQNCADGKDTKKHDVQKTS